MLSVTCSIGIATEASLKVVVGLGANHLREERGA